MNIWLIYPDKNQQLTLLRRSLLGAAVCEIIIEDFERIWSDFYADIPLITSNEVVNRLLHIVNEKTNISNQNPDLILVDQFLDFFNFTEYLKQWKKCDVFVFNRK